MRAVLRLGVYRRLLDAYALNALGFQLAALALTVLIYKHTGSAAGATAFFIFAEFLPALLGPVVVAALDPVPVRIVLPCLYALRAVLSLILAWTAAHFILVPILALALADGVLAATAGAFVFATSAEVTSAAGLLREGNAILNTAFSVCFMAGPALGGVLVAADGSSVPLLINGGLFAAIVLTLIGVRGLPEPKADHTRSFRLLRAALAHAAEHRPIRRLLLLQAGSLVFFTISLPVEIVFTVHSLHAGAGAYGALIAAWGAGALAGSALFARLRSMPTRALTSAGAGALGIGFAVMAAAPGLAVAVLGSAIAGGGNGVYSVAVRTAVQEHVTERFMTLAMSFNEGINRIAPGAGILIGGGCTALFGARAALGLAAAGSLLMAAMTWSLLAAPAPVEQPA